ncbi:xylan glycosyltransferase MUCI21-like [Diospyros lotus]|uniref:xylan glycosyltransferase MUCI21-like n=1 Tax=Diospyros lotus TaxID=55363 RepID=UPI002256ADAD|nr:xylan glycosyltransferase MUCI21-like [Diospyros lotus]
MEEKVQINGSGGRCRGRCRLRKVEGEKVKALTMAEGKEAKALAVWRNVWKPSSMVVKGEEAKASIKLSTISTLLAAISTSTHQGSGPRDGVNDYSPSSSTSSSPIVCDRSHQNYDLCSINGPTVLDSTMSTFYAAVGGLGLFNSTHHVVERVRPYPQKNSSQTMARIQEITLTSASSGPPCATQHDAPAVVFSVGGYTWNFFHAFIDGFIPLFITLNSIASLVDDADVVLVIADSQDWWVRKYQDLFRSFSKHPVILLGNDTSTHCFPAATVGLISHGFMTIDSSQLLTHKTTQHLHKTLQKTYCLAATTNSTARRPRLVLVKRTGGVGRVIMNQAELKTAAEEEGFEVIEFEPRQSTPLSEACELLRSSHAMVGVHGAALTYALFLPPRSVMVQVVGVGLEEVAELCFGRMARDMGFEYMEYRVGVEESSLVDRYGEDDVIVKDPKALQAGGWYDAIMEVYLRQQNLKLNMLKFRQYLKAAYHKATRVMQN